MLASIKKRTLKLSHIFQQKRPRPALDPVLPPELEELVFSLALYGNWKDAKHLILVAKRVHYWLIPRLYRIAIFHTHVFDDGRPRFLSGNLIHHGKHVRHIMLFRAEDALKIGLRHRADECLSWCPNATNVALWMGSVPYDARLITQLHGLHSLTQLSFNFGSLLSGLSKMVDQPMIYFPHVTHLELVGPYTLVIPDEVKKYFPSVTHLAIRGEGATPISSLGDFLACWKGQLKVFIWYLAIVSDAETPEILKTSGFTTLDDPRLIIMRYGRKKVSTWNEGAMGGVGRWEVADEIVQRRRREQIAL